MPDPTVPHPCGNIVRRISPDETDRQQKLRDLCAHMPHMKQPQYDRYFVCQYEEAGNYHVDIIHDRPNTGRSQRAFGDEYIVCKRHDPQSAGPVCRSHKLRESLPLETATLYHYILKLADREKEGRRKLLLLTRRLVKLESLLNKLVGSDNLDADDELGEGAEVDQAPIEGDEQAEDMDAIQAEPPHAENIDVATNDGRDLAPLLLHVDPADTEVQDTDRTIVTRHDEPMDHRATEVVQVSTNRNDGHGNSAHEEPDAPVSADDRASATVAVATPPSSERTPHIEISDDEVDDPPKSSIIKVTSSNEKPVQKHRKRISVVPSLFAREIIVISDSEDEIEPVRSSKQLFVIEPSSSRKHARLS